MPWSNFAVAVIVAIMALAVLFLFLYKFVPFISKAVDSIIGGIKKPICCNMFQCSGLGQANPICIGLGCLGMCG